MVEIEYNKKKLQKTILCFFDAVIYILGPH